MDRSRITTQPSLVRFYKNKEYTFNFPYEIGENDENDISVCNLILECRGKKISKKMSCKIMDKDEALQRMRNRNVCYFCPVVSFKQGEFVLCVGNFVGVQFSDWIREQIQNSNGLWRLDGINNVITAGPMLIQIAREIAECLTQCHQQQKPLGFNRTRLYIEGTSFKLSDPPNNQVVGDVAGIRNDLQEFVNFVNEAAVDYSSDRNIMLFNELINMSNSNDVQGVLILSYFICHSPLFWSLTERYQFANAYDSIRKQYGNDFDSVFMMNSSIYRVDAWVNKIPIASNHPLREVYNHSRGSHNRLLMRYIRYCYHHYSGKKQSSSFGDLDEELLALFPTAFSATYGELALRFNSFPSTVPKLGLLNHLHRAGLIYNRGNVRDRAAIREQRM